MTLKLNVIHADVEHAAILAPVFDAYRIWYGKSPEPERARDFLTQRLRNNESQIFMAMHDNSVAGFTQLYPLFSSVSMEPIWLLNDLFVVDEFRKQGVGSFLLQTAAGFAEEAGALRLELATEHDNLSAQTLYESLGWTKDTEFLHYSLSAALTSANAGRKNPETG